MPKKKHKKTAAKTTDVMGGITAYCMKCKAKRVVKDPREIIHSNGRAAVTGVCSACGTKIFRMGKMPIADGKPAASAEASQGKDSGNKGKRPTIVVS